MRFRLVIPAAIAAVATYLALVRDELAIHTHEPRHDAPTQVPASTPVATAPAPSPPRAPEPVVAPQPPAPPSQYIDLAPPAAWDSATPSVYDLLAGEPPASMPATRPVIEPAETVTPQDVAPVEYHAAPTAPPATPTTVAPEPLRPAVDIPQHTGHADLHAAPSVPAAEVLPPPPSSDAPVLPTTHTHHELPTPPNTADVLDEGRFALGGWAASAGHSMVSAVTFRHRLTEDVTADQIVLQIDVADNIPDDGLIVLADPGFAPDHEGFTLLLAAAYPGPFSAAGSYRVVRGR